MAAIIRPDVILTSLFSSLLNSCSRHHLKVFTVVCCLAILINATPHFLDTELPPSEDDFVATPDKRPARLSYFRSPYSSSRRRPPRLSYYRSPYSSSSWRRYGGGGGGGAGGRGASLYRRRGGFGSQGAREWWRKKSYNNRNQMPWDRLPNTNCLRDACSRDADCCRRFSKCNKRANVCYDCWYGHPCLSDVDCCANFPYCNKVLRTCGK